MTERIPETVMVNGGVRVRIYPDGGYRVLDGVDEIAALKVTERTIQEMDVQRVLLVDIVSRLRANLHANIDGTSVDDRPMVRAEVQMPSQVLTSAPESEKPTRHYLRGLIQ